MKTKEMVLCSFMAAVLCASGVLRAPLPFTPVPISLQVLAVVLSGALLGARLGCIAVGIYVLLGCFGLPVFAGMQGGISVVAGPTGGYITGFIPAAYIIGRLCELFLEGKSPGRFFLLQMGLCMAAGLFVIYAVGTLQLMAVSQMGFGAALSAAVLPFIPVDAVKIVAAAAAARLLWVLKLCRN